MKNSKFLYSIVYLSIFLFFIISPTFVFADEEEEADCTPPTVGLEVNIGTDSVNGLSDYVAKAYKFIIAAVGIFAAVKIIIAGLMWASAAGNSEMLSQAKAHLIAALTGLLIALLSYILLNTLNSAFINLKNVCAPNVTVEGADCDDDDACPTGQTCKSNSLCSDGSEGDSCGDDADCQAGAVCDVNTKKCGAPQIGAHGADCGWTGSTTYCNSGLYCFNREKCYDGREGDPCKDNNESWPCSSGLTCKSAGASSTYTCQQ